jgi:hypothetical protein
MNVKGTVQLASQIQVCIPEILVVISICDRFRNARNFVLGPLNGLRTISQPLQTGTSQGTYRLCDPKQLFPEFDMPWFVISPALGTMVIFIILLTPRQSTLLRNGG